MPVEIEIDGLEAGEPHGLELGPGIYSGTLSEGETPVTLKRVFCLPRALAPSIRDFLTHPSPAPSPSILWPFEIHLQSRGLILVFPSLATRTLESEFPSPAPSLTEIILFVRGLLDLSRIESLIGKPIPRADAILLGNQGRLFWDGAGFLSSKSLEEFLQVLIVDHGLLSVTPEIAPERLSTVVRAIGEVTGGLLAWRIQGAELSPVEEAQAYILRQVVDAARTSSLPISPESIIQHLNESLKLERHSNHETIAEAGAAASQLTDSLEDRFREPQAIGTHEEVSGTDLSPDTPSFPGYRLLRPIGTGATATVFLGVQESLKRRVALKVLRRELLDRQRSSTALERFIREVQVLMRLRHPGLITIFDAQLSNGSFFYAMEVIERPNLRDWLRSLNMTPVPSSRIWKLAGDVLEVFEYLHERGIIHRDIKPANLVIDAAGRTRVVDLGLVDVHLDRPESGRLTGEDVILGTPLYFPPEVWCGDLYTPASDLFQLGEVMYEMAVGMAPFPDAGQGRYFESLDGLERLVDPDLATFIRQLLEIDPSARPSSASEARAWLRTHAPEGTTTTIELATRPRPTPEEATVDPLMKGSGRRQSRERGRSLRPKKLRAFRGVSELIIALSMLLAGLGFGHWFRVTPRFTVRPHLAGLTLDGADALPMGIVLEAEDSAGQVFESESHGGHLRLGPLVPDSPYHVRVRGGSGRLFGSQTMEVRERMLDRFVVVRQPGEWKIKIATTVPSRFAKEEDSFGLLGLSHVIEVMEPLLPGTRIQFRLEDMAGAGRRFTITSGLIEALESEFPKFRLLLSKDGALEEFLGQGALHPRIDLWEDAQGVTKRIEEARTILDRVAGERDENLTLDLWLRVAETVRRWRHYVGGDEGREDPRVLPRSLESVVHEPLVSLDLSRVGVRPDAERLRSCERTIITTGQIFGFFPPAIPQPARQLLITYNDLYDSKTIVEIDGNTRMFPFDLPELPVDVDLYLEVVLKHHGPRNPCPIRVNDRLVSVILREPNDVPEVLHVDQMPIPVTCLRVGSNQVRLHVGRMTSTGEDNYLVNLWSISLLIGPRAR